MPFRDGVFALVLSFTMLHHLPSSALQDPLFSEAYRVLKPGGIFVATDTMWSLWLQLFHSTDNGHYRLRAIASAIRIGRFPGCGD